MADDGIAHLRPLEARNRFIEQSDVENTPSAPSLEWIGKSITEGRIACHTPDASTMSASPSRTLTR
jgi:hypothetical protein